ncbi:coiled-coil alpha-helical rod protein 1 isoform X2 [Esox lucius]|uniref:Coiled-coil alpha-helical rod protein 1 n=1 Tax=Esox lucius TaxID=8010 RepID=A0A3P8XSY0_ESOLU|nr:coiled-coil alpha-helical rod protein 1 isoform X2 [Esox lucius]
MERRNEDEKLNAPSDFVASVASKGSQGTLIPPSHFTASIQSSSIPVSGCVRGQGTTPITWATPATTPASDPFPANPWLSSAEATQEILDMHRENQRFLMLHGVRKESELSENTRRWETEWRLDTDRLRAEAERLKGQVEALKEAEGRQREEMRAKESTLNRQSHEMEVMRRELFKSETELSQVRVELVQKREDKEKLSTQLESLKRESVEEVERLRREVERSTQEAQRLTREAETAKLQAEKAAKQEMQKLKIQLEESHKRHETKLQQLTSHHDSELSTLRQTSSDLQETSRHLSQEVTHLKSCLLEVSAERDGLKEQLRQMGSAFENQSASLQSLRSYIGEITPERGLEEELTKTVQELKREKDALLVKTELLTVRLNSVNDILALQEEEMVEETLSNPVLKAGPKATRVLRRWREKVFMLLVQLHSKDMELRGEKDNLHSIISSLEQELKNEKYQSAVLQHSLKDRTAELDLERGTREAMEQDLSRTRRENTELKSWNQESGAVLRTMVDTVQRFSQTFEAKISEVETVQTRLNSFGQRLTFAKRRVDTIQGLMMRKAALLKVQHATNTPHPVSDSASVRELQAELALVCEERDKLMQELKRTPVLIENALADVREQFDSEVRQLRRAAEHSRMEVLEAQTATEEAQQRLQEAHMQMEESQVNLEKLHAQLISQQESSEKALKESVSETEDRYTQQLRMMESQLNTARREHTKAVVALRQFERQAEREREQERGAQRLQREHGMRELQDLRKLLQEKDKDRNLLLATVRERGLMNEYKAARTESLLSSVALKEGQQKPSQRCHTMRTKPQISDSLLSVMEDLQTLSAEVVHSSEDDSEEEEPQASASVHTRSTVDNAPK